MQSTLLSWMTFTPMIGVGAILTLVAASFFLKLDKKLVENLTRAIGLGATAVALAMGFYLWSKYDPAAPGLQFEHHFVWIRSFSIEYFMGVDGVSISMVLLTVLITFFAAIASVPWWGPVDEHHFTHKMVPGYWVMLLILETGMLGTFVALDFFLFYVFWEIMLLPMYFLIGIWGGPRKEYAAIKFFLYTLAGSVLMLLAVIGLYYNSGPSALIDGTAAPHTFNIMKMITENDYSTAPAIFGFAFTKVAWIALFIGFAIKIPMFPFHTWLPDAHVEAPTPISVILAGVLLKMGGYGILRINFGILPEATVSFSTLMAVFGTINIVYAAFVCMAQRDLKKLIAYSSVSHMGFVLLGMAAFTTQGVNGAMFQMFAHGIVSPMLFLIVGVIYDRAHHRNIEGFGGLATQVPEYTGLMGLAFFASLGLPGLIGFVGEFTVFLGAFPVHTVLTIISAVSVIITAAYYLWTIQRMFLGKLNEKYASLPDLFWRERLTLYPLAALSIVLGFYPNPIFRMIQTGMTGILQYLPK